MKLRPVTKQQAEWAIRECFDHYAYRLKSGKTTCMDCGHTWDTDGKTDKCVCPHCGMKLEIKNTQDRKISGKIYFNILGMSGKYQTLRMFVVFAEMRKGKNQQFRNSHLL